MDTPSHRAFRSFDRRVSRWLAGHALTFLRVSIGVVFVWFGGLKFVPGLSPADDLATDTIATLSAGLVGADAARLALAVLETAIGLGLLWGRLLRVTLLLLLFQMLGTVTPLGLFPARTWSAPFVPTLEGQYILKNVVLIAAAMTMGATVRGGGLTAEPDASAHRGARPRGGVRA